jgi:hypothetical protein
MKSRGASEGGEIETDDSVIAFISANCCSTTRRSEVFSAIHFHISEDARK